MKLVTWASGVLVILLASNPAARAADAGARPDGAGPEAMAKPPDKAIPEAKVSVTKHQIRLAGVSLAYTATAGTMRRVNTTFERNAGSTADRRLHQSDPSPAQEGSEAVRIARARRQTR